MKVRLFTLLATLAIMVVGMFAGSSAASAGTTSFQGCPGGAVCLYINDPNGVKFTNGTPDYIFYNYGSYNISGAYGTGSYVDNQYGGGSIGSYLCTGYGGTGTVTYLGSRSGAVYAPVQYFTSVNFTPVNSVKLLSSGWSSSYGQAC